jgi:RNA exonuclease 1
MLKKVLIDTLVAPNYPVTDMRTRIHGITEKQLQGVKFTLRHAQAALLNMVSDQTIIVGHSVYNDLKALHFNHE